MVFTKQIDNETEADKILNTHALSSFRPSFIEVGEEKICLPECFINYEERIRTFHVHEDDVYLLGHPKTGTTWMQEMIWLLIHNLNYEEAKKTILPRRLPLLEAEGMADMNVIKAAFPHISHNRLELLESAERPRCIKSHLHWSLLPEQLKTGAKQPKIIAMMRNAADTCVSHYYHSQSKLKFTGTFEDFCEMFLGGRESYGPFWKVILGYWEQRHRSNVLIVKFEEMKKDLPEVIRKVANFLENSYTEEQLAKLADHLSFDNMKKNESVNWSGVVQLYKNIGMKEGDGFIRKGIIGDHKNKMSLEMIERFEAWTERNLRGTGLEL